MFTNRHLVTKGSIVKSNIVLLPVCCFQSYWEPVAEKFYRQVTNLASAIRTFESDLIISFSCVGMAGG